MKFSDKLFFYMISLITLIFCFCGVWVVSAPFQKLLYRELDRAGMESRMFQYIFEMAYQSTPEEYGENYSLERACESAISNMSGEGTVYYVFDDACQMVYGEMSAYQEPMVEEIVRIAGQLQPEKSYGSFVFEQGKRHYLLSACRSVNREVVLYLAMCKDITSIYEDRDMLLNQYRMVMAVLLVIGSVIVYFLSRYITGPIGRLTHIAGRIAEGNLNIRSKNNDPDEIGELSRSFDKMADALVERVKEKEKEARKQEDFTAAFAHELKTPLTSIIGYADMLGSMKLTDAERSEAAFYIFHQGKRLESLSHKLLELVSMEHSDIILKPVLTKDLEENIRSTMRPVFSARKINGKISLEKDRIYADKDLLLSLLYNLLDNGCKALEPGGFLLLKGKKLENGYEFKIVDNGHGIPQEEISRITEAFYMVDKSRSRKEGGAGIGMALCQKIVEIHGGKLQIRSHEGEGTVVKVTLPERKTE